MSEKNLLETVGENIFSGKTGVQTVAPFIDVEAMSAESKENMLALGVDPEWVDTLERFKWDMINPFAWGAGKLVEKPIRYAGKKIIGTGKSLWNAVRGTDEIIDEAIPYPTTGKISDDLPSYPAGQKKLDEYNKLTKDWKYPRVEDMDLNELKRYNIPISVANRVAKRKSIFPEFKTTKYREDGTYSVKYRTDDELLKLADELSDVSLDEIINDPFSDEFMKNRVFVSKLLRNKYGSINDDVINNTRSMLRNELSSDESYLKWVKMQKKAFNSGSTAGYPIRTTDMHGNRLKGGPTRKPDISREFYNSKITPLIDETSFFPVPDREFHLLYPDMPQGTLGLFDPRTGQIFIKQSLNLASPRGKTALVHELKHAVQAPFRRDMDRAYGKLYRDLSYIDESSGSLVDENIIYNRSPHEVSARASEIRTGLTGGPGQSTYEQILGEVSSAFPRDVSKRFLDDIWGVAPLPILSDTERIKKVFSEEEE